MQAQAERIDALRAQVDEHTDKRHRCELQLQRVETEFKQIGERIWEDYELTYALAEPFRQADFRLGESEKRISAIRARIREMGVVNVSALDEYRQTVQRLEELTSQRDDRARGLRKNLERDGAQCMAKGRWGGAILYTDSTHIKAKANKHKKKLVEVAVTPKAYLSETGRAGRFRKREGTGGKSRLTGMTRHTRAAGAPRGMQSTTGPGEWDSRAGMGRPKRVFTTAKHRNRGQQAQCNRKTCMWKRQNINGRDTDAPKYSTRWREGLGKLPKYMGLGRGIPQTHGLAQSAGGRRGYKG